MVAFNEYKDTGLRLYRVYYQNGPYLRHIHIVTGGPGIGTAALIRGATNPIPPPVFPTAGWELPGASGCLDIDSAPGGDRNLNGWLLPNQYYYADYDTLQTFIWSWQETDFLPP